MGTGTKRIGILGAGITGMTAALELRQQHPEVPITIIDQKDHPGGLLENTQHAGHHWDHGVFFIEHNFELMRMYPELFTGLDDYYRKVWQDGNVFNFPFSFYDTVLKKAPLELLSLVLSYAFANIRCYVGSKPRNLREWLNHRFGAPLLELTKLPVYFGKLQGLPAEEISPLFGDLRFKNIHRITRPWNIANILLSNILKIRKKQERTIYYPHADNGIRVVADTLSKECSTNRIDFRQNRRVTGIRKDAGDYTVTSDAPDGANESIFSHIVSTIPINDLIQLRKTEFDDTMYQRVQGLDFLKMTVVFLLLDTPLIMHRNLVLYSFNPDHCWKRLCARSYADGKTTLVLEIPYLPNSPAPDNAAVDECIRTLTDDLKLFPADRITYHSQASIPHAYPIYAKGFEDKLWLAKETLEDGQFVTAGRQGDFLYANTDGAIDSAREAVQRLVF